VKQETNAAQAAQESDANQAFTVNKAERRMKKRINTTNSKILESDVNPTFEKNIRGE
jgi:hypothetical protein